VKIEADAKHLKRQQSRRLERIYNETITAWEASKNGKTKRRKSRRGDETIEVEETTFTCGDASYLRAALMALEGQRKLYGIGTEIEIETARRTQAWRKHEEENERILRFVYGEEADKLREQYGGRPPWAKDACTPGDSADAKSGNGRPGDP
jgi:hypothetical protein